MTCAEVIALVEPVVARDLEPSAAMRAHLESCPSCASAFAGAQRLEALLARRAAPAAPSRFEAAVLQRIRRERWSAEQSVDRVFNVAIVLALLLIGGGLLAMMNVGGLLSVTASAWAVMSRTGAEVITSAAPTLNTYVAAAGLLISALLMWWWAERHLSL